MMDFDLSIGFPHSLNYNLVKYYSKWIKISRVKRMKFLNRKRISTNTVNLERKCNAALRQHL